MKTVEERFWAKVDKNGTNGCWIWLGRKRRGYSVLSIKGRSIYAHRYICEIYKGKIPEGLQIDHLCRNKLCVNPEHLEITTNRNNVLRGKGITAKNAIKTHCINGHPFDLFNTIYYKHSNSSIFRSCRQCIKANNLKAKIKKE